MVNRTNELGRRISECSLAAAHGERTSKDTLRSTNATHLSHVTAYYALRCNSSETVLSKPSLLRLIMSQVNDASSWMTLIFQLSDLLKPNFSLPKNSHNALPGCIYGLWDCFCDFNGDLLTLLVNFCLNSCAKLT